jgi:Ca2+:H+ antiporter
MAVASASLIIPATVRFLDCSSGNIHANLC